MDGRNPYNQRYSSGADAFATPASNPNRYSQQQRQLDQQRESMCSTMTPSASATTRGPAPPAAAAGTNAWAPVADDEEDDDDDHWNVYDDFNNARPSAAGSPGGTQNPYADQFDHSRKNSFGSMGPHSPGATGTGFVAQPPPGAIPRSGTGATLSGLSGGQRQSLLPREAFGFDVQNSDPRGIRVDPYGSPGGDLTPSAKTDGIGAFLNEKRTSGYQNLNSIEASGHDRSNNNTGIELVTVPALGTEFSQHEMKSMARKGKRKAYTAKHKRKVGKWASGEEKVFGLVGRRAVVIGSFVLIFALAIVLYFVIPRVPSIAFLTSTPLDPIPDASGMSIGGPPANFSMSMNLNLRADNSAAWIPTRASKIVVEVTDVQNNKVVGKGLLSDRSFAGRKRTIFQLPVQFEWVSRNLTGDATFALWYSACGPEYPNTPRPTLTLRVAMEMHIAGLFGVHTTGTQLNNLKCPFALRRDQ
ncbi:unnamed protein product [Tilletia laevis]|uniref:Uncharacterized protein n=2 Tax=Tilletia TaxID=13289 RepID=A0A177V3M3_9BASI|nr:hypothetical protein CF336_g4405 [Tilletia laevis]KAE8260591.1 hypothetical protein A4X03_0g3768 [Tilletia caries]KAE8201994.1 hypothetical protein CF335_g3582 [Tilletia laevis]CAD6887256.1 unnamed protein product [Tilletia caries]CAD6918900.1 unnamed protein product [Tilletia laevis]